MNNNLTPSSGKIIIINGPSSAGKSTLARALQKELDVPFLRFSFDLFLDYGSLPLEGMRNGTFSWDSMRPAVFRGLHQCLPALATAGNNVIFDHIIETREWLRELLGLLAGLDVFFIGLNCSLPELERREMERVDRRAGDARRHLEMQQGITSYDLELDSEQPLEETVTC